MSRIDEFDVPPDKTLGGHPSGLYVLFGSEMWERFSFYGMRALLVLYLTKHLKMTDDDAGAIYGTYTGLVYVTPLLGGFLADKFLGQRKAILIGGIVMAMGHFAMAFEPLLYLALGLLIVGNGFFKANISTMVGNLYGKEDARRDGGYTIFYMGINLGALAAPLVCGTLGERVGWHYGFAAAGVGMVLGLASFVFFQRSLVGGFPPDRSGDPRPRLSTVDYVQVALIAALCLGAVYGATEAWPTIRPIWNPPGLRPGATLAYHASAAIGIVALLFWASGRRSARAVAEEDGGGARTSFTFEDYQRIAVIAIATAFAVIFWAGFEQAGNTLTLFADRKTDRRILGYSFPASYFQTVNPSLIVLMAPFFTAIWTALGRTRAHISSTAKLGIGLVWVGLGYIIMYAASRRFDESGSPVGPQWLASVYLLHTIGELCLSPIGLSLVNKLAPARIASMMMAVWFLAPSLGNYLGGTLDSILKAYNINLWVFLIFIPIGSGLVMLALNPLLRKMSHGRD